MSRLLIQLCFHIWIIAHLLIIIKLVQMVLPCKHAARIQTHTRKISALTVTTATRAQLTPFQQKLILA